MQTPKEIQDFLDKAFPHNTLAVEHIGQRAATVRKGVQSKDTRPGNTISGPTMMAVADAAIYIAILGELGGGTQSVTTQLAINFLRRPKGEKDIVAKAKLVKLGRSLIVGQAELYTEGEKEMVALATATYTTPNKEPGS
ncbi:MAG: PaaI family thioesterase [Pseudomonadota bacterium]